MQGYVLFPETAYHYGLQGAIRPNLTQKLKQFGYEFTDNKINIYHPSKFPYSRNIFPYADSSHLLHICDSIGEFGNILPHLNGVDELAKHNA